MIICKQQFPTEKEKQMANEALFTEIKKRILAALEAIAKTEQTGSGENGNIFFNLEGPDDHMEIFVHNGVLHSITFDSKEERDSRVRMDVFEAKISKLDV